MNEVSMEQEGFNSQCARVLQVAKQLFQERPDWVTFFRETLGVNGAARSVFNQESYVQFEQSSEFSEIQKMVSSLRTKKRSGSKNEVTRVITVRLPESLHESLKAEASDHRTSMNKLCISKLLQVLIDNENNARALLQANAAPLAPRPAVSPAPVEATPAASPQSASILSSGFRSTYAQGVEHGSTTSDPSPRFGR